jgi:hypothetical protein
LWSQMGLMMTAMTDEYGTLMEWRAAGKPRSLVSSETNLLQRHCTYHRPYMGCPENDSEYFTLISLRNLFLYCGFESLLSVKALQK